MTSKKMGGVNNEFLIDRQNKSCQFAYRACIAGRLSEYEGSGMAAFNPFNILKISLRIIQSNHVGELFSYICHTSSDMGVSK